ncbi:MAG: peptidylprolyl isomerase [Thermomicrobiales bacterium]
MSDRPDENPESIPPADEQLPAPSSSSQGAQPETSSRASSRRTTRERSGATSSRSTATMAKNPARRVSRRDQEARQQRLFLIGVAAAAALVIAILAGGLAYEYYIKPNQVLAEVNGHSITRRDYWKYQSVVLYQQARIYENYASQTTGQQQSQFLSFAASLDAQREKVWGSTDVSAATVQQMIENQIYVDAAEEQGIALPDDQVQLYALNAFAPADDPLVTPIPTPTMIPARAEAATQTAEANLALTPTVATTITPTAASGTPAASPVTGVGTPAASPVTAATPTATVDPKTLADAGFTNFQNQVFDKAHMSLDDYYRLFTRPQMAREQIDAQLQNAVPQAADQVHLQHILVATEDLATQLANQAKGGADFSALAKANSTDTQTAPTGGDLGWVTHDELDQATADAAFSLAVKGISDPIQTPFGWEIVRVIDKQADRPLTDAQYSTAQQKAVDTWLADQRSKSTIKTDYAETPTPTPSAFEVPAGAPTIPPATPIPAATPVLGPVQGPPIPGTEATPIGPEASPASSPEASPAASRAASPETSPQASPSPAA